MIDLLFRHKNKKQQIRLRRLVYAMYGAFIHTAVCVLLWVSDLFRISGYEFIMTFFLAWIVNGLFFTLIYSGMNEHIKDPSLTIPMMLWSITFIMYTVFLTTEVRELLLMFNFFTLVFGTFHLGVRAFIVLACYGMFLYLCVIQTLKIVYPSLIDPHIEWIAFFGFSLVSLAYVVIASEMSSIRDYLRNKNNNLTLALDKIESISITDELTQIKNRRYILEVLKQQSLIAQRNAYPFSVCLLDIDMFKNINDYYGHLRGDEALIFLCKTLETVMRKSDYFARFGGEEFLVIFPLTTQKQAEKVAERMRALVENTPFEGLDASHPLTVSMGVTEYHAPETVEALLGRVDKALYLAKAKGRNNVASA